MHYKNAAIIVAGIAAQQVVATGDWSGASPYSCPGNTNNQCSDQQQGGYDWSGLDEGSFSSYGGNKFSGFECSQSFGKRDLLTKRSFQSKCITGNLDDQPSWSSEGEGDEFSINEMQVSSTQDTEVDCEYGMPDGSTCHETHSCSSGGSVFKNTQCGGAKSVTFKPGRNAPSGCSIGVHSVGFHCGPPSSSVPVYSSTPKSTVPASTGPASSYAKPSSSASSYGCYGEDCESSSAGPTPSCAYGEDCSSTSAGPTPSCAYGECSSSAVPTPSSSCKYGEDCGSSSAGPTPSCAYGECSSSAQPTPSCKYGEDCGSSSAGPTPSCAYGECSASAVSTPSCKYGEDCGSSSAAPTPSCKYGEDCGSSSAAPTPSCKYGEDCGSSSAGPTPSCAYGEDCASSAYPQFSSTPATSSSAPPDYPTPNCPDLLPKCLNTWMFKVGCKDNSDTECFCENEDFIKNVMGCISAWSGSEEDTQAAASYLMGLCAKHVPNNPAIITACPSTVTPTATVPATHAPPASSVPAYTPGKDSTVSPVPTSKPAYSTKPVPSGHSSSPVTPEQTAPCTTITYSKTATIPATYSHGPSQGYTMTEGSSYTTEIVTTVTVPQVQMTTKTVTEGGKETKSVGLGAGSPSSAPAYTTPAASTPGAYGGSTAAPVGSSTFGTSYAPGPSASYGPVPATGMGAKVGGSFAGVVVAAVAAVAAL